MIQKTLTRARDFETIAAQFGPCELVRGEVIRLTPGGYGHSRRTFRIGYLIERWASERGVGRVISNEAGLIVETDPDTVRGADVAYYSYKRLPRDSISSGFLTVPPELVVEVLGAGQGWPEVLEKVSEYLRMGVDRVWTLDPDSRHLHVFRQDGEPVVLGSGDVISDESILPGFSCTVSDFFID